MRTIKVSSTRKLEEEEEEEEEKIVVRYFLSRKRFVILDFVPLTIVAFL